jgi:peptidoglycan/xylan/chitin deacetylase (PgdA/CDA1 family)
MKIRLQPIRVFCLHHVCEQFDADAMYACDWMALDEFRLKINALRSQGYQFISLTAAYEHLKKDWFRYKKYAVLTFDDGYKSIQEMLPWLEDQQIPATLFINGKYLDGVSYRNNANEKYLTYDKLFSISLPLIEIGSHGYEHADASKMSEEDFQKHINMNIQLLQKHPNYVPFHAYTWGRYKKQTNDILKNLCVTPVYVDGIKNYNEPNCIHRENL